MKRAIPSRCIVLCAALQLAAAPFASAAERKQQPQDTRPQPQIYRLDRLTKEQFDKLPDNQLIEVDGERTPKRVLRARAEAASAAMQRDLERHRSEFLQAQRSRQDARNARAWAELNRLQVRAQDPAWGEQRQKVLNDIKELTERAEKAPSAERERMEREARDLLRRYNDLTR